MVNCTYISRKSSQVIPFHCLPTGRHSEAAHEKRLLCAQKMYQGWGGVGWDGMGGVGWGGVGGS